MTHPAANIIVQITGNALALHFGSTSVVPHVKSGKLVPLAVTGAKRSQVLPSVPTVDESGLRGYDYSTWTTLGSNPPSRTV